MITTGTEIVCPRGTENDSPIVIDLREILKAEARQDEVAFVTPAKAPELLATFNTSWRELHRLITLITAEKLKAEKALNVRKAIVLLDEAPEILKKRGLSSSADNREAVLQLDEKYSAAEDRVNYLTCVLEYLKGKAKSFENAYSSVKKIMSESGFMASLPNTDLSGNTETPVRTPGFGKARY